MVPNVPSIQQIVALVLLLCVGLYVSRLQMPCAPIVWRAVVHVEINVIVVQTPLTLHFAHCLFWRSSADM